MTLNYRNLYFLLLLVATLSGCISNSKVVYLQDKTRKHSQHYANTPSVASTYKPYRLQPEDVLSVQVSKLPTIEKIFADPIEVTSSARTQIMHPYLTGYPVNKQGNIDVPTLGEINVLGLTLDEAQVKITAVADKSYTQPSVRVFLLNFNVTVLGEVLTPNRYTVYTNRVNVLEAIGMAGDCTDFANRSQVKVLRTENGKSNVYYLNLNDENLLLSEGFYLHPNDVIMISPLQAKKFAGRGSQTFIALVSALAVVASVVINLSR